MTLGDKIGDFAWKHPVLYYAICAAVGMAINLGTLIFALRFTKK